MTKQEQQELIQTRIDKALVTIAEAQFQFEHQYWNTAVNKLYYSCFYAVSALLASIDVYPKRHQGIQQMFSQHFIKTAIFTKEANKFYSKLFEMRQ